MCTTSQLIVTSWSRAGLPVGRLRIGGELAEIDSALRFDHRRAAALLNDAGGLRLPRADVQLTPHRQVGPRRCGWPRCRCGGGDRGPTPARTFRRQ